MKAWVLRHALMIVVLVSFAHAQDYSITNIGWLPGLFDAKPYAINGSGQVVGVVGNEGVSTFFNQHAFLWTKGIGIQDLGPGGAYGINDSGYVTGYISTDNCGYGAVIWKLDGSIQCLGIPQGWGNAINRHGEVAGLQAWPNRSAFFWSPTTGVQYFGADYANGMNDARQVVGRKSQGANEIHAYLWTEASGLMDLGTLGGDSSIASGINNSGQVVGYSTAIPGNSVPYHPFLWTQAGGMQDLGVGTTWAASPAGANALNKKGQVVGKIYAPLYHAALWTKDGVRDLNDHIAASSGWLLDEATAINDAGQIAVTAYKAGNYQLHALVLSPKMTTTLISSRNPCFVGQTVRFTATVTNSIQGPPPNGESVVFTRGTTVLGTGTLYKGVAQLSTSSLTAGGHSVNATYIGDINYAKSSAAIEQVVNKWPTRTTLVSSLNPSNYRQAVTLTATVHSQGPTPTGRIIFRYGANGIAAVPLTEGIASVTISWLPVGTDLITAWYQGSSASQPSTSAELKQVVK
ncbi:MAG TPA: Ig-like domain repeat protein [Terriglobales bacterium]